MKPLEPKFEIYELGNKYLVRYYHGIHIQKHIADSMENALRFIQSFYEKPTNNRVVQFKKTDADLIRQFDLPHGVFSYGTKIDTQNGYLVGGANGNYFGTLVFKATQAGIVQYVCSVH